jgi:hypothetical protein
MISSSFLLISSSIGSTDYPEYRGQVNNYVVPGGQISCRSQEWLQQHGQSAAEAVIAELSERLVLSQNLIVGTRPDGPRRSTQEPRSPLRVFYGIRAGAMESREFRKASPKLAFLWRPLKLLFCLPAELRDQVDELGKLKSMLSRDIATSARKVRNIDRRPIASVQIGGNRKPSPPGNRPVLY